LLALLKKTITISEILIKMELNIRRIKYNAITTYK